MGLSMRAAVIAVLLSTAAAAAIMAQPSEAITRLKETGRCSGCDLFGANLSGLQAPNADLSNALLQEAIFYGGDLRGANFTGASLDGANLKFVNLEGAVGIIFGSAITDERTICPNGEPGPCEEGR